MNLQTLFIAALLTLLILAGLLAVFPLRGSNEPGTPAPHALDQTNG
ncbi:hypothetical protein SAMN05428967_2723 [Phyllobacterium sp. YR620]|uniref:Uncharacterized protein n=1 Tax=Phyllobacterium pellucidum TaxID=2740464 RepID=A0A849VLY8_9HYPH|nr:MULTISPECIES: hypothetical protein [Phyllobacterium]NTS29839.1 hypothetical protein [Phyllobacterium pellucidum]UGY08352.1 hypothetical protein LLE51_009790 [Phyllobacterium sp. T1018]SDP60791.1 hypothetical protein SAMN05428967_2723 [Phyllobacterium sp. YR620]